MKYAVLKKLLNFFHNNNVLDNDVLGDKKYLESLKEPQNDIQRSYCQYLCQMHNINLAKKIIINCGSLILFLYYVIRTIFFMKNIIATPECIEYVITNEKNMPFLPECLKCEMNSHIALGEGQICYSFTKENFIILIKDAIRNRCFSLYFIIKLYNRISWYQSIIEHYNPQNIICFNEYSFTSSYLTRFCNNRNIKHINVMHGEKLYFIGDSFFRFDECYVWDEFYKQLFLSLRADKSLYKIAVPSSLSFKKTKDNVTTQYDFIYYLQNENIDKLYKIRDELLILMKKGFKVAYRAHPLYENANTKTILEDIDREESKEVTIEHSILRTRFVIARYSTVLYQAYLNGVQSVIDDVTDQDEYENLKNLNYMMINKTNYRLSQFIK